MNSKGNKSTAKSKSKSYKSKGYKSARPVKQDGEGSAYPLHADNDVSWYTQYPSLVASQAGINFNLPYGGIYENKDYLQAPTGNEVAHSTPGGYIAFFRPALTAAGTAADPLNVALKNFYTFVRHANSGHSNYEDSDLYQYLLAVIGLYPLAEAAKRDLRLIFAYKSTNRYVYRALLTAKGYTSTEIGLLSSNYANYVTQLNILIAQLNSFKVPKEMALIKRWEWLSQMVFKDDELDKCSYYMFAPESYYKYDWANHELNETYVGNTHSLATYMAILETEINNILNYEDCGIMLGDIIKAYGNENCHVVAPLANGEIQDAVYSQEAGEQFRNMCVMNCPYLTKIKQLTSNTSLLTTTQDGAVSDGYPTYTNGAFIAKENVANLAGTYLTYFSYDTSLYPILMADSDTPTADKVIINTRLQFTPSLRLKHAVNGNIDYVLWELQGHGTEVVTRVVAFMFVKQTNTNNAPVLKTYSDYQTFRCAANTSEIEPAIQYLYPTRFAPQLNWHTYDTAGGASSRKFFTLADGLNNIVLNRSWLDNMAKGCLMSLLTLPMFKLLESRN